MKANCAMLAGRYGDAINAATALKVNIDTSLLSLPAPMGYVIQLVYMVNMYADVRFQKWDSLLQMEKPDPKHIYQSILYHFGRGMAYAGKGQYDLAVQEQVQLQALSGDESLKLAFAVSSPFTEDVKVANEMLMGAIAQSKNDLPAAITHFRAAAETEEHMNYGEPRDWFLNPKQYLGTIYLQAHQWQNAEDAFKRDLKVNALNVWSLHGLTEALQQQKKTKELAVVKKQLQQASVKADVVSR
jgi:tetratricopeptide (TPR) repeat protein